MLTRRVDIANGNEIIFLVPDRQDRDQFRRKNWAGTFEEYLNIVRDNPLVARTAFQRICDMILSYGRDVDLSPSNESTF